MKKASLIFSIILLVTAFGCKSDADVFTGDYSYKTSGDVHIEYGERSLIHSLKHKTGQLRIVELGSNDSVLLIKNQLGGSVETLRAQVTDDSIFIKPYRQQLSLALNDTINGDYEVTVSGKGIMYDKNTLVLNETYYGTGLFDATAITIYSNEITTFAQRND